MDDILSVFGSNQNIAALRPLLASAIQDAISNQKHSSVTTPQDSAMMAEDPQFSPQSTKRGPATIIRILRMPKRFRKGFSDPLADARPWKKLEKPTKF